MDILEKGYSTFSQVVVKSTDLHIKSKAIYLFLCAYKNTDNIATPKRETIMNYLGIGSKETYYKYMKELEAQGYIEISTLKVNNRFFNNQYKIITAINEVDLFTNYGIIPKKIMNDKSIPIEAKGLYGYFCAHRNKKTNDVLFMNLSQLKSHLGFGSNTRLNKNINILVEAGYIEKEQYSDSSQRFSSNLYHLLGYREKINTKKSKLSDEEVQRTTQQNIEARDLKNKIYKQVIETENRLTREIKAYEDRLKENLGYKVIKEKNENLSKARTKVAKDYLAKKLDIDLELYDFTKDIINIILRMIFSEKETIKLLDTEYPKAFIKEMFLKLRHEHIQEELNRYKNANNKDFIRNPSGYMEVVLTSVCFDYGLVKIRNEKYGT